MIFLLKLMNTSIVKEHGNVTLKRFFLYIFCENFIFFQILNGEKQKEVALNFE